MFFLAADGLAIFGLVLLVVIIAVLGFVGFAYSDNASDSGNEERRTPRAERIAQIDDLGQMLETANERRRAQGLPELDRKHANRALVPDEPLRPAGAEADAPAPPTPQTEREPELEDIEIEHALELRNKELRRRGKPEMTKDQLRELMRGG